MKSKRLLLCTVLVLIVSLVALAACAKPSPTAKPTTPPASPTPTPAPAPTTFKFDASTVTGAGVQGDVWKYFGGEIEKRTEGKIKVEYYWSASLSKPTEEFDSLRVGLSQLAWVLNVYHPKKLYLNNFSYATVFSELDPRKAYDILAQLYQETPELTQEYTVMNTKPLALIMNDSYELLGKTFIKTPEDLKGKKVSISGGSTPMMLESAGAVVLGMPLPDRYSALQTGLIDLSSLPFSVSFPWKHQEVAKFATWIGLGAWFGGSLAINMDAWNKLDKKTQDTLVQIGADTGKKYAADIVETTKGIQSQMEKLGVQFYTMTETEKKRWADMMPDIAAVWIKGGQEQGLPAAKVMKAYLARSKAAGWKFNREWAVGY